MVMGPADRQHSSLEVIQAVFTADITEQMRLERSPGQAGPQENRFLRAMILHPQPPPGVYEPESDPGYTTACCLWMGRIPPPFRGGGPAHGSGEAAAHMISSSQEVQNTFRRENSALGLRPGAEIMGGPWSGDGREFYWLSCT